ncbi:hypothetical protein HYDPIDRAFT_33800 [Hydnomerulius pinastri MD-312]|uniref:Anoctamin transmembrane domain-containing protein n=1 Tax=Hydnomerulius pinastri MD-312 TaxID=994086 RepID=A0A0C9VMC8_9AGAM|nr:hypothetical protein HYDPIDRAFT_33800 [Hydnomerulius pinastri MD-312]
MASVPMILLFASALTVVLTGIRARGVRDAAAFSLTLLFMALVPKLLEMYKTHAKRFTSWENHAHQSSHANSLSTKVFTLSAMNAYLGLAPSAFVYVPFGGSVMHFVHYPMFFSGAHHAAAILERSNINLNETVKFGSGDGRGEKVVKKVTAHSLFEANRTNARRKLNPSRPQEQMFAFTVTSQVERKRERRKKKRVAFEDEPTDQGQVVRTKEEGEFLETVRSEVSLPEYEVFEDYGEMVTQFGYVALWSTIWPLAPVMALFNNYIEARSDAFKIAGLESLSFLTWLSALTNSALVYPLDHVHGEMATATNAEDDRLPEHSGYNGIAATKELLVSVLFITLLASHALLLLRTAVRHILELPICRGSKEMKEAERVEREIKERYLEQCSTGAAEGEAVKREPVVQDKDDWSSFWAVDEGLEEIQKTVKDV